MLWSHFQQSFSVDQLGAWAEDMLLLWLWEFWGHLCGAKRGLQGASSDASLKGPCRGIK